MQFKDFREIESRTNQFIKLARSLKDKKNRTLENLFLAEGIKPVIECLKAGVVKIIMVDGEKSNRLEENIQLVNLIETSTDHLNLVLKKGLFEAVAATENPQGILAICKLPEYEYKADSKAVLPASPFIPVLENINDPGNCGTILRLSAGMGINVVILTGINAADPFNPKAFRASAGYAIHQRIFKYSDCTSPLKNLKENGYKILVADSSGQASLRNYPFPQKTALILGSEARGLTDETMKFADTLLKIPLAGSIESYNVATAAAVFFYEYSYSRKEI